MLNLRTRFGSLGLVGYPAGGASFDDLARRSIVLRVSGVDLPLAALTDVIDSKAAADRAKDRAALPVLRELLRRLRDQG